MVAIPIAEAITNLGINAQPTYVEVTSSSGTNAQIPFASGGNAGLVDSDDKGKLDAWISVLDYGADPTNTTDSRDAFTNALSAADTAAAAVYVPAGTYRIDSQIQLAPTNTIIGEPGKSIIQAFGSSPGDEFTLMKRGSADCSLNMYGMVLRHNGQISGTPDYAASQAIDLNRAISINIDRCEFYNCPNACISLEHELATPRPTISITNCLGAMDNGDVGALFVDIDNCESATISGNVTTDIARSVSIELTDGTVHTAKNIAIIGNRFIDGAGATISTTNTCIPILLNLKTGVEINAVSIVGNVIADCASIVANQGYAIMLKGSTDDATPITDITVSGNVIDNWSGNGSSHVIFCKDITHCAITGNTINDPTWTVTSEAGLYIENCQDMTVTGNIWTGTYDPAVIQTSATAGANVNVWISSNSVDDGQRFTSGVGDGITVNHRGTGSPESGMHADIGSLYQRSDGGGATTLYIKESGTFDSGWVAVQASSGSRKDGIDDVGTQSGSSYTVDFDAGTYDNKEVTVGNDMGFTLSATNDGKYRLRVRQDGTGGRTITLVSTTLIPAVVNLPLDSDSGQLTVFEFEYDSTNDVWIW